VRPFLQWAASLGLLAAVLYFLDWQALVEAARTLTLGAFAAAVVLACMTCIPLLRRWYLLAGGAGGWYLCSARYLYANLLNAVSPGSIGGDVYRFFAFRGVERDGATLVAILVKERLLGVTSMLIGLVTAAATMELTLQPADPWLARSIGLAAAGGLAALVLIPWMIDRSLLREQWRARIRAALAIRASRQDAALLGWSLVALALWVAAVQFVSTRLGLEVPWSVILAIVTSVEFVRVVPITIQGIGIREGAFAALFGLFGYPHESGFVIGAASYLALSVALAATGALGALMLARTRASSES